MTDTTATWTATDRTADAGRDASTMIANGARRLWHVGLGIFAVTAEQAREAFEMLEQKGEQVEPTLTAPFKRASEAATRAAERAGVSAKSVGGAVSNAASTVADAGRKWKSGDLAEEVQRLVDKKLSAALERLDIPTKKDLQALADRIDRLVAKANRAGEGHNLE